MLLFHAPKHFLKEETGRKQNDLIVSHAQKKYGVLDIEETNTSEIEYVVVEIAHQPIQTILYWFLKPTRHKLMFLLLYVEVNPWLGFTGYLTFPKMSVSSTFFTVIVAVLRTAKLHCDVSMRAVCSFRQPTDPWTLDSEWGSGGVANGSHITLNSNCYRWGKIPTLCRLK